MKVLITGANGQLGHDAEKVLIDNGHDVVTFNHDNLDITNLDAVLKIMKETKPDVVLNAAAYTNVDGCETEVELAYQVNALGARNVAIACNKIGAKLVHISTDYVFDGNKKEPYIEFDDVNPQSVYGKSKLAGEELVKSQMHKYFIIRTSWLYGHNGNNFVKTMLRLAKEKDKLTVVNDQIGSPTYTVDLAKVISNLMITDYYGIYHCSNNGFCSWYDFAKEIYAIAKIDIGVEPVTTEQFNRPAPRPKYSVMRNFMLQLQNLDSMPEWQYSLKKFLSEELF